jgi:hypothetical protein
MPTVGPTGVAPLAGEYVVGHDITIYNTSSSAVNINVSAAVTNAAGNVEDLTPVLHVEIWNSGWGAVLVSFPGASCVNAGTNCTRSGATRLRPDRRTTSASRQMRGRRGQVQRAVAGVSCTTSASSDGSGRHRLTLPRLPEYRCLPIVAIGGSSSSHAVGRWRAGAASLERRSASGRRLPERR